MEMGSPAGHLPGRGFLMAGGKGKSEVIVKSEEVRCRLGADGLKEGAFLRSAKVYFTKLGSPFGRAVSVAD